MKKLDVICGVYKITSLFSEEQILSAVEYDLIEFPQTNLK